MALHADIEWELRYAGDDDNGGGFKVGASGSDFSQQDAAELTLTDVVANGSTTLTSVTGGFLDGHVGNIINVLTKGRREITARTDTNTITVDSGVSAGSGLTGNVGGAAATFEEIDTLIIAGNTIHVKNSGHEVNTFTLAGAVDFNEGTSTALIKILGYNSSRGDTPTGTDRPLIICGNNQLLLPQYSENEHLRGTSDHIYGFYCQTHGFFRNCYMISSGNDRAFRIGAYSTIIDCKAEGDGTGQGFDFYSGSGTLIDSFSKGKNHGFCWDMGPMFVAHNTFKGNGGLTVGAYCNNINGRDGMIFFNNNFYDCGGDGIFFSAVPYRWYIVNNNFKDCGDGIDLPATSKGAWLDYNNFHGNTVDVKNCVKGPNTFSFDPQFVDAANDNFNMEAAAQAFITRLGVG